MEAHKSHQPAGAARSYRYILLGFELPMNLHHKYLEEGEGVKETKTFLKIVSAVRKTIKQLKAIEKLGTCKAW